LTNMNLEWIRWFAHGVFRVVAAALPDISKLAGCRSAERCTAAWVAAALLLFFAGCGDKDKEKQQVFTDDDLAVEIAKEVEILYSDSAVVRVRVLGPVMYNFTDRYEPKQEFPAGVKIEFLESDRSVRSTLTAKTAVREQEKSTISARDSVVLVNKAGEVLETEELIWDEKTQKVRTDKFVKVTKPGGEVLYGFGLEANQDFSYWKIVVPKGKLKVKQLDAVDK
jgi:LPS export ABC transporter protein LptC